MTRIHMYLSRHLFVDDDCVGKLCTKTKTVRLFDKFEHFGEAIRAWLRQHHACHTTLAKGGDEAVAEIAPPVEFPADVVEMMSLELGDLTPSVVAWARENWSKEDFERRYKGRVDGVGMFPAPLEPDNVLPMPATGTTPVPKLSDEEQARKMLELADVQGAEFREGDGFLISYADLHGISTESWSDAATDLLEAIEYAAITKKPEDGEAIDLSQPPVAHAPARPAAANKAAKKAAKKAQDSPVPTEPAGPLKELEDTNEAALGDD